MRRQSQRSNGWNAPVGWLTTHADTASWSVLDACRLVRTLCILPSCQRFARRRVSCAGAE